MHPRSFLALSHDALAVLVAWLGSYWLRFNLDIPQWQWNEAIASVVWLLPLHVGVFWFAGLYRGIWRYASLSDLKRILFAVGLAAVGVGIIVLLLQAAAVPRSVLILHPLLLMGLMGGSRLLYRAWKEHRLYGALRIEGRPVLVLGAGDAAADLLRELARSRDWRVVGLLDDDPAKFGRQINGVRVVGFIADIAQHAAALEVAHVIVALPGASAGKRRRATELAVAAGLQVLTVPAFEDLLSGKVAISQVRRVELEDLLGRDKVALDDAGLTRLLAGRTVLVTGAGGSIGSELCRQIARFKPERLVFFEQSEFALYAMDQEFSRSHAGLSVSCIAGDVRDEQRLCEVFAAYRPAVVFHAAAYKHVPMMEGENAWQAVRNNVLGTWRVARAAVEHGVGEFVLISTDKAVNPTNVMGTTKRLAERVCQALQAGGCSTRFVMVRFGNVLGSSGSVIPKFREQIASGGPITVTHPDIVRYFMLIPEAAQLVLQAALQGQGGETFVLDMGEPIKIVDLARDMIRLSGFTEEEIRIEYTGLRPGEKLYEELLADGETTLPTPHPKLRVTRAEEAPDVEWLARLETWLAQPARSADEVKRDLQVWVPEYRPARH
ncbi:MAG: polysaccharide biosynthesis protein [Deltaproteobacteria bacterium]|nr:polysaccharide biosynthesis protein [Deltaproteobacteria bacterium]